MWRTMSDIRVERALTIGHEAAWAAALRVAERIKEKAQANYRIVGDSIEFERSGAKGKIVVTATHVVAEVSLSLLLRPMRGVIESKIDDYFTRYFQ
jgi:putative polyhydroxyalkanoate system protein